MRVLDDAALRAEAAGDDHPAVLGERLADRVARLLDRRVDEAAGVDDHEIRAGVVGRRPVALRAELGEDALGVDERLGTAEGDETDARRARLRSRRAHRRRGQPLDDLSSSGFPSLAAPGAGTPGNGNAENIRDWFWNWSCICLNIALLCSM